MSQQNPNPGGGDKKEETQPAKMKKDIRIVLADGTAVPATVEKKHKGGLCDLLFNFRGAETRITSSPHDPEGKRPDSWHEVEVPA